jgi:energy-converting hydrogenase Eha subunit C
MREQYFFPFAVGWIALAVVGTVALGLIRHPGTKLAVQRALAVFGGALFVAAVWFFDGSTGSVSFAAVGALLIVLASLFLVRVCDSCSALVQPRYFVRPSFCSKCGARLK